MVYLSPDHRVVLDGNLNFLATNSLHELPLCFSLRLSCFISQLHCSVQNYSPSLSLSAPHPPPQPDVSASARWFLRSPRPQRHSLWELQLTCIQSSIPPPLTGQWAAFNISAICLQHGNAAAITVLQAKNYSNAHPCQMCLTSRVERSPPAKSAFSGNSAASHGFAPRLHGQSLLYQSLLGNINNRELSNSNRKESQCGHCVYVRVFLKELTSSIAKWFWTWCLFYIRCSLNYVTES